MEAPPSVNNQSKRFTLINGNKIFKAKIYISQILKLKHMKWVNIKKSFVQKYYH